MRTLTTFAVILFCQAAFCGSVVDSLFNEGERAYRSNEYQKAIDLYTQVLNADPEHMNAYLQRGFCYSLKKDYSSAVKDFTSVIQRRSDHLWAYTSRGSAFNKIKEYQLAMIDFNKVIQLDPKNEEAYNNRGWSKKFLGDEKGACKDWKVSKKLGNGEAKIIMKNNYCK